MVFASATAVARHALLDPVGEGGGGRGDAPGKVKTFTNLYSRANDDTRQNSAAGAGGQVGDAYEVTLMRCQLKTEVTPDGKVKAGFNWNAQMTTGRHLGEADSYEMRWVQDATKEKEQAKDYRAPDSEDLGPERQKTLKTKWRAPDHKDGNEEVKRGSSMTVDQFNLAEVKANGKEQVIKGKLEIRLRNWKVLDKLYNESKHLYDPKRPKSETNNPELVRGFKGGVFQLVDYELKVNAKGEVVSGDVFCRRPKDPNFKLFLSNYKEGFKDFDPDTYDDVRFDYCRVADRQAEAKAKGKTLPKHLTKITHEFPQAEQPSAADCKQWAKISADRNRRYRDQPPGANCELEDVGGVKLTKEEQQKKAYEVPKGLDASERQTLKFAKSLDSTNCASCHGKETSEQYAKANKGKEAGYRVCDSGNFKDGTPLFLGDMMEFLAPMVLEGKLLPNPGGRYPTSMMTGLDKMVKAMIKSGAEEQFKNDPQKDAKVASATSLWDQRKKLGQAELPADNPLMKQLREAMAPARSLFCQQATVAGINDRGSYVAKQCETQLFDATPFKNQERQWAQSLEVPNFAEVLGRVELERRLAREWQALRKEAVRSGLVDSLL